MTLLIIRLKRLEKLPILMNWKDIRFEHYAIFFGATLGNHDTTKSALFPSKSELQANVTRSLSKYELQIVRSRVESE